MLFSFCPGRDKYIAFYGTLANIIWRFIFMYEENIRMLLNAVVEQAATDYIDALCKKHWNKHPKDQEIHQYEIDEIEKFFMSEDFNGYTQLDGGWLMRKIRKLVEECNYDTKEITKRRQLKIEEEAS